MHTLLRIFFCGLLLCILSGCQPTISNDAKPAYDAYLEFVADLRACSNDEMKKGDGRECDKEKIWNEIDVQTKSRFQQAYGALVRIDRIIETYFDNIEHQSMRARTGTDILQSANIKETKDLFFYMFKPDMLVIDSGTDSGLVLEKSYVNAPDYVTIQTHAKGQLFPMILEDDGVWRTAGLLQAAEAAVEPILASEAAMKEYAKGNLKTELERREKVRKYFLVQQEIQKMNLKGIKPTAAKPAEAEAEGENAEGEEAPIDDEAALGEEAAPTEEAAEGAPTEEAPAEGAAPEEAAPENNEQEAEAPAENADSDGDSPS